MTLERANTSEAVAAHILERLFAGRLRSGQRIDLDEVAAELGVSRVPVREALIQLERDGLVDRAHYRRAHVAEFGEDTVREAFALYGMLSALTNRRVAARRDPGVLDALGKLDEALSRCDDPAEFESLAREFRRVVNVAGAGNHLRALLRTFSGLVPAAARFSIDDALTDERAALRAEYLALRDGTPDAAGAAALAHLRLTADNAVRALHRRGVFQEASSEAGPLWTDVAAVIEEKS
ncbi:GntR family transcriptional regulator [Dactylosporangium sucinum]|uniref:GntR family transcriptional regulator n=1 Tax=Dactylosporangium sucinum TaxID=1424081 RepID=A0A917UI48_9ACTN|nr:GntR family transcriptional regulator [Dactylosporangium sucinum]GGM90690.1 GntR family transcriptional regulator [Dactylosporangium sucinum]